MSAPGTALIAAAIAGLVVYSLGHAVAVSKRARSDYRKTKAAVPGLRKDWWRALWTAVKIGFWVAVGYLVLVAWNVKDGQ